MCSLVCISHQHGRKTEKDLAPLEMIDNFSVKHYSREQQEYVALAISVLKNKCAIYAEHCASIYPYSFSALHFLCWCACVCVCVFALMLYVLGLDAYLVTV